MTESEFLRQITQSINDLLNGDHRVRHLPFPQSLKDTGHENELRKLSQSVNNLIEKLTDADTFILELSKGNLDTPVPKSNQLISPFEELQSNLQHLVWQTHKIAEGDYSQKINFLGEFSTSYNKLISSLKDKQVLEETLKANAVQLKELNETKDKFFSIIAHDLRNPFNAILNLTDFIIESLHEGNTREALRMLSLLQESAQNTYNLLQNLLEWSLIQQGNLICRPAEEMLLPLVEGELSTIGNMAQQKDVGLDVDIPDSLMVYADHNMLKTILRNLISNSIKYSNPGGSILISASREAGSVVISVRDNGIGMNEDEKAKIFLLSTGDSRPGTRQEKGSGLGLMLCREFVSLHHGSIDVESEAGKGSKFHIRFPDK